MSSFAPGTDPRVMAAFNQQFPTSNPIGRTRRMPSITGEAMPADTAFVADPAFKSAQRNMMRAAEGAAAGRVDDYNRMVSGIPGFPSFNAAKPVGGQTLGSMPSDYVDLIGGFGPHVMPKRTQDMPPIEAFVSPPAGMQDLPEGFVSPLKGMQQQQQFNPYQQQQQFNPYQQFQQPQFNPMMGGGLGGLFSQMGGYGMGYNPMMGGFGGGFGGFNPYMGGGFGGFGGGFNPYMGSGFGGGFNPMMGGGQGFGGFGGGQGFGGYNSQGGASPFGGGFGGGFGSRGFMNQMGGGFGGQQGVGGQGPNSFQG